MRQAKFLSRPIFFKSGWNWTLKFDFLGHYSQKTIFQTKWTKNVDELKNFLVWFSSTKRRGQLALSFLHKIFEKNSYKIFMLFSQAFSSRLFTWALLYLRAVLCCFSLRLRSFLFLFYNKTRAFGWQNTDRNSIWSSQTKKSAILFLSKHSASDNFLPPSKGYTTTHFEFSFGININFIYSNSPY